MSLLLLAFLLLSFRPAAAEEGLFISPPPGPVAAAAESVFARIASKNGKEGIWGGSVFVYKKLEMDSRYFLVMGTAAHVVRAFSESEWNKTYFLPDFGQPAMEGKVVLKSYHLGYDIGLFMVEVSQQTFESISSLEKGDREECGNRIGAENYVVGFPMVSLRKASWQKVKIEDPLQVRKRWSHGFLAKGSHSREPYPFVGSTADAMDGNSGGPVLSPAGHLIGVVVRSMPVASDSESYHYLGREKAGHYRAHMQLESCENTVNIMEILLKDAVEALQAQNRKRPPAKEKPAPSQAG